ncbi:MAG: hypothetical protein ACRDOO_10555 [Actinomadura sp.]
MLLALGATPASAHPHDNERPDDPFLPNHCTPPANIHVHTLDPGSLDWLFGFDLRSATETFRKTEGQFFDNFTDQPINFEFTSTLSEMFSTTSSQSLSSSVTRTFVTGLSSQSAITLSSSTTFSRTIGSGVKVNTSIPPRTRAQVDFGSSVADIKYIFHVFHRFPAQLACVQQGVTGLQTMIVPMVDQGWRLSFVPLSAIVSRTNDRAI